MDFNPRLQSRSSFAKSGSPLVEPSKFLGLKNLISPVRLTIDRIEPLLINTPLIQTSKYLTTPQQKSSIGWDSWKPRLGSNYSTSLLDRSDRISPSNDEVNLDNSDILTTIFHPILDIEDSTTIDDVNAQDEPQSPTIRQDDNRLVSEDKLTSAQSEPASPNISNRSDFNRSGATEIDRTSNPEIVVDSNSRSIPNLFLSAEIRSTNIDFAPTIFHESDKIEEFISDLPITNLVKEQNISEISVNNFQQSLSNRFTPLETTPRNVDAEDTVFDDVNEAIQSMPESSVTNLTLEVINPKIDPDSSVRSREHIDLLPTVSHEIIGLEKTTSGSLVINPIVNRASPEIDIDNFSRSRENIDSRPTIFHESISESSAANLAPGVINSQIDVDNTSLEPTIFHKIIEVDESSAESQGSNLSPERITPKIDVDNSDQLLPEQLSLKEAAQVIIDRFPTTLDPVNEVDRSNSELLPKHIPVQISDEIVEDIYAQSAPNVDSPPTIFNDLNEIEESDLDPPVANLASIDSPPTILKDLNEIEESDLDPPVANLVQEQVSLEIVRDNFPQTSQNIDPVEVIFFDRDEIEMPTLVLPTANLAPEQVRPEIGVDIENRSLPDRPLLEASPAIDVDYSPTIFHALDPAVKKSISEPLAANLAPDGVSFEIAVDHTNRSTIDRLVEDKIDASLPTVFKIENELDPAIPVISKPELLTNLRLERISPGTLVNSPTVSPRLDLDEHSPTIFRDVITDTDGKPFDRIDLLAEEIGVSPVPIAAQNDSPVKGYATGGQVADTHTIGDAIHPSDTVAAMLTPKEFVVNVRDAQKNLNLLEHINSGRELTEFTPPNAPSTVFSDSIPSRESPAQISTKVESFVDVPLQLKRDDLLKSPSLAESIEDRPNSIVNNFEDDTIVSRSAITNYDSLPLIFRKSKSSNNLPETQFIDPPTQWNSVEDLLTGNNNRSTIFNFPDAVDNGNINYSSNETYSPEMMSHQQINLMANSTAHSPSIVNRFTNNDQIVARDIATDIEPITETISAPPSPVENKDDAGDIEVLAREIYHRLRQRLEVERERQGIYTGRLTW